MRAYKAIFIVITVVASLFSVAGVALSAITYDTVYVDDTGPVGGNHFHDIETALSLVNPDGTIYIAAGYYDLSLPLVPAADVAFIGEGADVVTIDATGLTSALNIEDVSVYIYGCSITGAHTCVSIDWNNGEGTYEAYLHNNAIYGAMELDSGISLGLDNASGEVTIRGNEIYDNSGYGISVSSIDSDLVLVIEGNAIHGNDDSGIFIYSECGSLETHIDGNEICGNGAVSFFNTGINIRYFDMSHTPEISITDNEIYDNHGDGILMEFLMTAPSFPGDGGAVPTEAEVILIEGNAIDNNDGTGIYVKIPSIVAPCDGVPTPDTYYILSEMVVSKNTITSNGRAGFDFYAPFFISPEPDHDGNGGYLDYSVFLEKNVITGNAGGGIRYLSFLMFGAFNNLIAGNTGVSYGLDVCCFSADIVNCTITGNSAGASFDVWNLLFANNIVTSNDNSGICGNATRQGLDGESYMQFYFNDVWGNGTDYTSFPDMTGNDGNISVDPQFAGPTNAHLQTGSPCIDAAGFGAYPFIQDDLEDTPRPLGDGYDMGCYEARSQNWTPQLTKPLASLHMARANAFWNCLKGNLPAELSAEATALVDEVQSIMAQAVSLGNPVMTSGLMQQAQELMAQLEALLGCGCS